MKYIFVLTCIILFFLFVSPKSMAQDPNPSISSTVIIDVGSHITALAWSPNDQFLGATDINNRVHIWSSEDWSQWSQFALRQFQESTSYPTIDNLHWSDDEQSLVFSFQNSVQIHDIYGNDICQLNIEESEIIYDVEWLDISNIIVLGDVSVGTFYYVDVNLCKITNQVNVQSSLGITPVVFSQSVHEEEIVVGTIKCEVLLLNLSTLELTWIVGPYGIDPPDICMPYNFNVVVDNNLLLFNNRLSNRLETWAIDELIRTRSINDGGSIFDLTSNFSSIGFLGDNYVYIYNMSTRTAINYDYRAREGESVSYITELLWSSQDKTLAVSTSDGYIHILSLD